MAVVQGSGPVSMQSSPGGMTVPVGVSAQDALTMTSNGEDTEDQHANKRPRLEESVQEEGLDEAVLALAANNPPDTYPSPTSVFPRRTPRLNTKCF